MVCTRITDGNGRPVGWVCGPRARRKYCACGRESTKLCDYPLKGKAKGRTCSVPLCDACAVCQGEVRRLPTGDEAALHRMARRATEPDVRERVRAEVLSFGPDVDTVDYCPAHARKRDEEHALAEQLAAAREEADAAHDARERALQLELLDPGGR